MLLENAVAGSIYWIETSPNLNQPWELLPSTPARLAHAETGEWPLPVDATSRSYRFKAEPTLFGIADVMVTDEYAPIPADYTGLPRNASPGPFIPGAVGVQVIGADVNAGIGGSTTRIWIKHRALNPVRDAGR